MKEKLRSRKFWTAIAGVVIGIGLAAAGNVTEGTTAIISSILGYLVAEGYIDSKAVEAAIREENGK